MTLGNVGLSSSYPVLPPLPGAPGEPAPGEPAPGAPGEPAGGDLGHGGLPALTATWAPPPSITHLPAFQGIPIQQQLGIVGVNKMPGTVSKEVGKAESQEAKKR